VCGLRDGLASGAKAGLNHGHNNSLDGHSGVGIAYCCIP
jgi:hypothetical protein